MTSMPGLPVLVSGPLLAGLLWLSWQRCPASLASSVVLPTVWFPWCPAHPVSPLPLSCTAGTAGQQLAMGTLHSCCQSPNQPLQHKSPGFPASLRQSNNFSSCGMEATSIGGCVSLFSESKLILISSPQNPAACPFLVTILSEFWPLDFLYHEQFCSIKPLFSPEISLRVQHLQSHD